MSTQLPVCAPAGNQVWCTDVLPFLQMLVANNPTRCELIQRLFNNWTKLGNIAYKLAGGDSGIIPPQTSTTEMAAYGFWGDFIYSFEAIDKTVIEKNNPTLSSSEAAYQATVFAEFSFFANQEYCFGPYTTIAEAASHSFMVNYFVNGVPVGGVQVSGQVVVDMDTGLGDITSLIEGLNAICNGCPDEFGGFMQCCQQEQMLIKDRLDKILKHI